jgi:circadian clock protein KaiC
MTTNNKNLPLKPALGITKLATGIQGLDEVLTGGIPQGRAVMVSGGTGSGKTVLLNEFLYRGIIKYDQPGVFITFEERPADIITNVSSFGWDYTGLIEVQKLNFLDLTEWEMTTSQSGDFSWDILVERIANAVRKISAERVVIDSLTTAFTRYSQFTNEAKIREMLFTINDRLKEIGVTSMISTENPNPDHAISRHNIAEFVADGVIGLQTTIGQNKIRRVLKIIKMRGMYYRSGNVEYDITNHGIEVYPKIPIDTSFAITNFNVRKSTGIKDLDVAMGGGIPEGHIMLIGGNTGTGKTTLGLHFIMEGAAQDESSVWVALEEPVPQVIKTAEAHGWDLESYQNSGKLKFVRSELIDVSPDQLLYQILDAVNELRAQRVVIDSVSSLESALLTSDDVRDFLIILTTFFKTRGVCCYLNYLNHQSFGGDEAMLLGTLTSNEMRLSSIVDGILLMRYVERDQQINKLLNIFKLRGSNHTRDLLQYNIGDEGLIIGSRFDSGPRRKTK